MNSRKQSSAVRFTDATPSASDRELLDGFDDLVLAASRGERDAIGALAIGFTPPLLDEARAALGPLHEQDAADVVHDFFLGLAEARFVCPRVRGGAIPWMKRIVRAIAAERLAVLAPEAA
jgi:hypothetical protein